MRSLIILFLCGLLFSQCEKPIEREWHLEEGFKWAELPVSNGKKSGFTKLESSVTGIHFNNSLTDEQIIGNQHLLDGSGVALGDVDNDGYSDIYFCHLNGPNVLYRNKGNWEFEDISEKAGVAFPGQFSKGAVFADIDGDRDLDLLVTALDGPNACFINDGAGKFTEVAENAGLASLAERTGNTSMALGDIDGDRDLDLYMVCYKYKARRDREIPIFNSSGMILYEPDYGERDILYLNDGKGSFKDVALTSDTFMREDGTPVTMPRAWGLTARMQDVDNDGDPDIYVCNDFASADLMWINNGKGKFQAVAREAIRTSSLSSMTVDFCDIDRDGDLDFFVADMLSREHQKRKMQMGGKPRTHIEVGKIYNRPQIVQNMFYINRGDGTYAEIANYSGVQASDWTWSSIFMDVDLDGYEDLLVTNGHAYDVQDYDTQYKIIEQKVRTVDELRKTIFMYPRLDTPNFLFRNQGDLTFKEIGKEWGFDTSGISQGMALADLDNDGDLDVVVNNLRSPAGIYENKCEAPRVAVRLRGLTPNTHGIGAQIELLGSSLTQKKEVISGGQYLSSSEPLVVFAATEKKTKMKLKVVWRNGKYSIVDNISANRIYEIDEAHAQQIKPSASEQMDIYFEDVSERLKHMHFDKPFNDFYRQPLLPKQLSQLGPGLSWFDIDNDQDDDLIIGSGHKGQFALYRNDGDLKFTKISTSLTEKLAPQDQTTSLAFHNAHGNTCLMIGVSNYENVLEASPPILFFDFVNNRFQASGEVPAALSSTGPLALSDYDNDEDLDLFVGGRVLAGQYPKAASSHLYRNVNGDFVIDSDNSKLFKNVGLVSAAIFSDIDLDGDSDLILAVEWGSVMIFNNESGQFNNATEGYGLAGYHGWWNGITTGDLDEDGRLDIITTNWGLNSKYHCDPEHPIKIYYKDFDNNGTLDMVEAAFDQDLKQLVPVRGFSFMSKAISFIRGKIGSYEQFGRSSVKEIIGSNLKEADSLWVNTLAHTVFLNRGNEFDAVEFPAEAQFSPAFYAGVTDFDGDGHEDVFLSQNFFAIEPETPRLDAGRGLWLRGDGTGKLKTVSGQESGIKIYGEQRGAALCDFDQDGRIDLAVSQNGAETKLYRNIGGQPGIRVRLIGPKKNPSAVGAIVRLIFHNKSGPVRQVHAGSGYWSQDSAVLVLGTPQEPEGITIRWPGGNVTRSEIPPAVKEVAIDVKGQIVSKRN